MELYILRHGIAEARENFASKNDNDRPLTPEGARKMRRIAKGMKALGLSFDLILTSPLLRARQTAEIVAPILQLKKRPEVFPPLSAGEETKKLVGALRQRRDSSEKILLVGHEPDLSGLISRLVSGSEDAVINLKKGGLCKMTMTTIRDGRCAILEWLLAPSQLVRIR